MGAQVTESPAIWACNPADLSNKGICGGKRCPGGDYEKLWLGNHNVDVYGYTICNYCNVADIVIQLQQRTINLLENSFSLATGREWRWNVSP